MIWIGLPIHGPRAVLIGSECVFSAMRAFLFASATADIAEPLHVWRWSAHDRLSSATSTSVDDKPLPLSDKPSIAVLPFDNMSGDTEQEFFADGITEDIITALSRFPNFVVIARNSCFTYKGKSTKVQDVGKDLGVNYVLEGSVRKAGRKKPFS